VVLRGKGLVIPFPFPSKNKIQQVYVEIFNDDLQGTVSFILILHVLVHGIIPCKAIVLLDVMT
jgi:hypothetical protein